MKNKIKIYTCIRVIIYIVAIICFLLIAAEKITTHCYWNDNYNFKCPTCGMTRATICLSNFNIREAIKYNWYYVCVLLPIAGILVFNDVYVILKRIITKKNEYSIIEKISGINGKSKKVYSIFFIVIFILFITYGIMRNFI